MIYVYTYNHRRDFNDYRDCYRFGRMKLCVYLVTGNLILRNFA